MKKTVSDKYDTRLKMEDSIALRRSKSTQEVEIMLNEVSAKNKQIEAVKINLDQGNRPKKQSNAN